MTLQLRLMSMEPIPSYQATWTSICMYPDNLCLSHPAISRIDKDCLHWLVVDENDQGVGTARLFKYSDTIGKVGRVAVLSKTRGAGLGRVLMEAAEKHVIENTELTKLALSSQVPRKGFYEKCGFVAEGEIYLEEGQPHVYMTKELRR